MNSVKKFEPVHPFLNRDVILNLSNGVVETIETMAGVKSTFDKPFVEKNWKPTNDISVFLNLNSSLFKGRIYFHFNKLALVHLYEKIMGETVDADSVEIIDCLGEISNICYGFAKAKLNDKGLKFQMSIPQPCKTVDLEPIESSKPHIIIPLVVHNYACQIQIVIF